ncbi:MAG: AzlD domain-containing protein [Vicinamibacterales bacterium]
MTPAADSAVLGIAGMAALTYLARAGGLAIARALPATPFVTAFLKHLGTCVIVALVTSTVARSDGPGMIATVVTVAAASRGWPTSAMLAGMAVAAMLRAI